MTVRMRADDDALDLRLTPHDAIWVDVAANVCLGATKAAAVKASIATRNAGPRRRRAWRGMGTRPMSGMGFLRLGARAERWQQAAGVTITPWGQSAPGPNGPDAHHPSGARAAPDGARWGALSSG